MMKKRKADIAHGTAKTILNLKSLFLSAENDLWEQTLFTSDSSTF